MVLHHLVVGAEQRAIATPLYFSRRSIANRVAAIKRVLGTSNRFCLGVRAVRYHLVTLEHVLDHAHQSLHSPVWHPPTQRQAQILQLLADGKPAAVAARESGTSVRTVRRYILQLANRNGARNHIHAGALFAALGWLPPTAPAAQAASPPPSRAANELGRATSRRTRWAQRQVHDRGQAWVG